MVTIRMLDANSSNYSSVYFHVVSRARQPIWAKEMLKSILDMYIFGVLFVVEFCFIAIEAWDCNISRELWGKIEKI